MRVLVSVAILLVLSWNSSGAQDISELRSQANSGDAAAQFELGLFYENRNNRNRDQRRAVDWYTKSASQGFAKAQFNLGRMYIDGRGVDRDINRGVALQIDAAEQGMAEAQLAIGKRYFFGIAVEPDLQQGLEMFEKAANQGLVDAQNQLGTVYFQGAEGVDKDIVRAHMWFTIAADAKNQAAKRYIPVLEAVMDEGQVENARALAAQWRAQRASE
ncbi:MAG: sel1 repeat family protein [Gammaproteobacteria bacterium]|nr:sel1 repeat family protein [Gammaproteobacteria bacterium]